MSVIVKGMEMPESCFNCHFHSDILNGCRKQTWCYLLKRNTGDATEKMPQDCSLVELPENYGRLIDGTELAKILETAIMNMKTMAQVLDAENNPEIKMEIKAYCDILNGVKDMEAVIEAEGNDG